MSLHGSGSRWSCILCACVASLGLALYAPGFAQTFVEPPVQRLPEPSDPLAPWTLEPYGVDPATSPAPAAFSDSTVLLPELVRTTPGLDDDEPILVVVCRQVLVSHPERAELLEQLLHVGVRLENATRSLGILDYVENVREYAVDELHPDVREQIVALPDSAWSRARLWRGRYAFFQILGREVRPRSTVPRLGEGLGASERARLSRLQRLPQSQRTQPQQQEAAYEPAAVVEQKQPDYPPAATGAGQVVLVVEVGRLDAVLGITVESSTDPIFEGPAIDAARESTYRAARRGEITEPGTVRLTYQFTAPNDPAPNNPQ